MEISTRQAKEIVDPAKALVCVTVTIWLEAQGDPGLSILLVKKKKKGPKLKVKCYICHGVITNVR